MSEHTNPCPACEHTCRRCTFECSECGTFYGSRLAALECAEFDTARTRG